MEARNIEYLEKRLDNLGLRELREPMKAKITELEGQSLAAKDASFSLSVEREHFRAGAQQKDKVDYTLNFGKSETTNYYHLNSMDVTIKNPIQEKDLTNRFYLEKGTGFTSKESYNLLSGRSVIKENTSGEGQKFDTVYALNFEREKSEYGSLKVEALREKPVNIGESLRQAGVTDLANPMAANVIIDSIKSGNLQKVSLESGQDVFVQLSKQDNGLKYFDKNMKPFEKPAKEIAASMAVVSAETKREKKKATVRR